MTEIFVCKPGALSDEDHAALREAGVVVVRLEDPTEFRLVRAQPELNAGDILAAALTGLSPASDGSSSAGSNRAKFVEQLAKAANARVSAAEQKP
jgi:hypothetical protein